jgi:hypothetical protein
MASNDCVTEQNEFGRDVKGSGCGLFKVLIRHLPEGTWETKEIT